MKKIIYLIFITLSIASCKKDGITVKENKTYSGGGISLELKPDDTGSIFLGGDTVDAITYKISGNTLKVKHTVYGTTFKFKIISETELQYEGKALYLQKR